MARGTIPLALSLIRWREVGQFYFGDWSEPQKLDN